MYMQKKFLTVSHENTKDEASKTNPRVITGCIEAPTPLKLSHLPNHNGRWQPMNTQPSPEWEEGLDSNIKASLSGTSCKQLHEALDLFRICKLASLWGKPPTQRSHTTSLTRLRSKPAQDSVQTCPLHIIII